MFFFLTLQSLDLPVIIFKHPESLLIVKVFKKIIILRKPHNILVVFEYTLYSSQYKDCY